MMEGPGADSEEKREPVSDTDIAVADSLKVLDLKRPIREADVGSQRSHLCLGHLRTHTSQQIASYSITLSPLIPAIPPSEGPQSARKNLLVRRER